MLAIFFLELKFNKISPMTIIKIPREKIVILKIVLLINSLFIDIKKQANITNEGMNNGITILLFNSLIMSGSWESFLFFALLNNSIEEISGNL
jgi:hypothetical protein